MKLRMTKLSLALACVLAGTVPAHAAIDCVDANATSAHTTTSSTTYSISYTTPSPCTDCVTLIGGGRRGGSVITITGATLGGNAATPATDGAGTSLSYGRLFIFVNPPSGTNTAEITYGDTATSRHITVMTCSGVDQANPIRDFNQATAVSTGPTVTVATVDATDVLVDLLVSDDGANPTAGVGANQTVITGTAGVSATSSAAMSRQSGADGGVMSWTTANDRWTVNAVSLRAATAASSDDGGDALWFQ